MNTKNKAIYEIEQFLLSDDKGLLLTGTNKFKKHKLIMALLEKNYKNAKILFRINAMENITNKNFIGLLKKPKSGEKVRFGNNYYFFDSFNNQQTMNNTDLHYNFAIVYPIDPFLSNKSIDSINELYTRRNIGKIFFCTCTDKLTHDLGIFSEYYDNHVIYDSEEEDPEYHKRVMENFYR